jgi:RimJ/RimL family protein N-acetyltransferase
MTPEFIEALLEGDRERASEVLGLDLPEGFPHEGAMRFFRLRLGQMREDERFREWCPHAVVLQGRMIGHAGYHGPPGVNAKQRPDAIEIGYTIEEPWRGHGYATAAAAELLRLAEERGITHYVACTAPDNEPSLAIIRKLGFEQTGEAIDEEDGLELVFELER